MSISVKSPNPTFTGVKAGIPFANGKASVDDKTAAGAAALVYFRTSGYTVGGSDAVERDDLPHATNAVAEQTFPGTEEEDRGRHDVAVPPPSAGVAEWRVFARGYNLRDVEKGSKEQIIDRARALGLIDG